MDDVVRAALAGERRTFAPLVWEQLPRVVNAVEPGRWWSDPTTAARLAIDLAGSCDASALVVPLLGPSAIDEVRAAADPEDALDDVLGVAAAADALDALERIAVSSRVGAIGLVPSSAPLTDVADEAVVGDALCDLARDALERGALAILVAGPAEETSAPAARIARLAENFARPVIAVDDGNPPACRQVGGAGRIVVADAMGGTAPGPGLVLTPGDVSSSWDIDRLRRAASG